MLDVLLVVLTAVAVWTVALPLLAWPHIQPDARRRLSLLVSAAGVVFLIAGLMAEGAREVPTVAGFLFGSSYITAQAQASAALPYYVATAVCLLMGTAGLAVPDATTFRLGNHWLLNAVLLSLGVTALRFALERVAAPSAWTRLVGITWLAPLVGAWCAAQVRRAGGGRRELVASLVTYAYAVRMATAALYVAASGLELGTHYDVSRFVVLSISGTLYEFEPGGAWQILILAVLPQLVFWPAYTVLAGMLGATLAGRSLERWLWPPRRRRAN